MKKHKQNNEPKKKRTNTLFTYYLFISFAFPISHPHIAQAHSSELHLVHTLALALTYYTGTWKFQTEEQKNLL